MAIVLYTIGAVLFLLNSYACYMAARKYEATDIVLNIAGVLSLVFGLMLLILAVYNT